MEFPKDPDLRRDKNIILTKEDTIATIQLNRPDVLNALNHQQMSELSVSLEQLDTDNSVNCIIIAGNEKESVLKSFEVSLKNGLEFERKNFYMLFSTEDQKEGMKAFAEKRKPQRKDK